MKKLRVLLPLIVMTVASSIGFSAEPVNPNATPEARKLLAFLHEIQGKYTLAGQHNFINSGSKYTDLIKLITGKSPIIWGSDFSFAYEGDEPRKFQHCGPINLTNPPEPLAYLKLTPEEARERLVKTVIRKHQEGYIITLMWHACPPGEGDTCDGAKIWAMERRPTPEQWTELTTDGTPLNSAWKRQADVIAGYLKQLQDAKVPVLWRPYHEMNGVWFWWCNQKGEQGFKKLWIMMYDYYVNHHKLNNLIWVWNTNAPRNRPNDEAYAYEDFWPGIEYVDVLAADVYRRDWKQSHHDDLLKLAQGKPIALGEVGDPPTPEILDAQPRWAWFMPWGWLATLGKSPEVLRRTLADKRVLCQGDVTIDSDGTYKIKPR
ncbi:MAG TPA: glycosyl hydrolase [Acidobacteriota bacterium]|nr:glycosyl hydrolase [Acidobacteriota bacterium]